VPLHSGFCPRQTNHVLIYDAIMHSSRNNFRIAIGLKRYDKLKNHHNFTLNNHKGRIKINFCIDKKIQLMFMALPNYLHALGIWDKVAKSNYKICMSRRNIQS